MNLLRRDKPEQDLDAIADQTDALGERIAQEIGGAVRRKYSREETALLTKPERSRTPPWHGDQPGEVRERTKLEQIAQMVVDLTWTDAVAMGDKVLAKLNGDRVAMAPITADQDKAKLITATEVTAAIQAWAAEAREGTRE